MAETYIPLLDALHELVEEGIHARLTLTLTPILLEQLADEDVKRNFEIYLEEKTRAAAEDLDRFEASGETHFAELAKFYREWYSGISARFRDAYGRDLVGAFRQLQSARLIEIATSAATHGYLPLFDQDASIHLQLRTAVESYKRHFGRVPSVIWLPECAYRPGYLAPDGRKREGLETFLDHYGLDLFFAETHMIEGGQPVGVAAGEAIGPYGAVVRRYLVPKAQHTQAAPASTYQAYYVGDSQVAVIGRNNRSGLQVWSADWGYPGDFDYREFHKKDGRSGMQYWRVTGADVDLAEKDIYHPDWAAGKVEQHADHFARLVEDLLGAYAEEHGRFGVVASNYDTELFGHWWFEGIAWIKGVLKRLARSSRVELMRATDYLRAHPPSSHLYLPEGSWGAGGTHFVWDNTDTHWMWPVIHAAESRMLRVVEAYPDAKAELRLVLDQAARELLLLQSSDWPFLVTTGQAKDYAIERFRQHVDRFENLIASVETGTPDHALAGALWERDKVFPEIDYKWFAI
jgi:1,4-alpha-glucan branching enzyme